MKIKSNEHSKLEGYYLDDEEQFWDYKTGTASGNDLFDTSKTGISYYDDFIKDLKYMQDKKNLTADIVMMSPMEYFEGCAEIFNSDVNKQIEYTRADKNTIEHLKEVINKYHKKFPITFLNYAERTQEGRHRMLTAAELTSWDTKFPVMVIKYFDEDRQKEIEDEKKRAELSNTLYFACKNAKMYNYANYDEFKQQVVYELEKKLGDGEVSENDVTIQEKDNMIVVSYSGVSEEISKDEITLKEPDTDDDFDIKWDDIDLDDFDLDDFDDIDTYLSKLKDDVKEDYAVMENALEDNLSKFTITKNEVGNYVAYHKDKSKAVKRVNKSYGIEKEAPYCWARRKKDLVGCLNNLTDDELNLPMLPIETAMYSGLHTYDGDDNSKFEIKPMNEVKHISNHLGEDKVSKSQLKDRAKKHKKHSKGLGWYKGANFNSDAGDVEKGIEAFNNSSSLGETSCASEGLDKKEKIKWEYNGPVYYRGNLISKNTHMETVAKSKESAKSNILFRLAGGYEEKRQYDIVDSGLVDAMPSASDLANATVVSGHSENSRCDKCGTELDTVGECPNCDHLEHDIVLEGISNIDALSYLNGLDV